MFLGGLGLLAVLVLWFPEWLTTPRFRALYPLPIVRALIQAVIAAGLICGCISMLLRRRKVLGLTGSAFSLAATLLGGGGVALPSTLDSRPSLGLDWFLLNLLLLVFNLIPLPPLDGSGIVGLFLGERLARRLQEIFAQPLFAFGGILLAWLAIRELFWPLASGAILLLFPEYLG